MSLSGRRSPFSKKKTSQKRACTPINLLAKVNQLGYCLYMEKRIPHYNLPVIKDMIKAQKVRATLSALTGGAALGLDVEGIIGVVMALNQRDFYKSMTTYADHRIWQDVYRPKTSSGDVYLKLTVIDEVLIVSFKEL